MKPLFLGLTEMYKHKITHLDISKNNITFDGDGYKFIDFGMSCKFSEKENILIGVKRNLLGIEFIPYPYEFFIYMHPRSIKGRKR